MKVFAVEINGVVLKNIEWLPTKDVLEGLGSIAPDCVQTMSKWVFDGWVPSIITEIAGGDDLPFLELWLARNNIPYSNLLTGVTSYTDAIKWAGVQFFVCSDPERFQMALAFNPNLRLYVMKSHRNKDLVDDFMSKTKMERIHVVENFSQIDKLEKGNDE